MAAEKPRRLGRGLEALLAATADSDEPTLEERSLDAASSRSPRGELRLIPIAEIRPNPFQPRRAFNAEALADLEVSLRENGLLQPVTVRGANGRYELVAGERRLRAASRIGWTEIPALVREIDDRTLLTLALVENLQRSDLNPVEEGEGYQRLIDEFGLTQQQVAEVIGKDRSTVANMLRVLHLPVGVRRMLQEGKLTLGHARSLLPLGDEQKITEMARQIVAKGWSVREVEERVRPLARTARATARGRTGGGKDGGSRSGATSAEARQIEDQLRRYLQTDVRLALTDADKGTIAISFYSADDLQRVLELMLGAGNPR